MLTLLLKSSFTAYYWKGYRRWWLWKIFHFDDFIDSLPILDLPVSLVLFLYVAHNCVHLFSNLRLGWILHALVIHLHQVWIFFDYHHHFIKYNNESNFSLGVNCRVKVVTLETYFLCYLISAPFYFLSKCILVNHHSFSMLLLMPKKSNNVLFQKQK